MRYCRFEELTRIIIIINIEYDTILPGKMKILSIYNKSNALSKSAPFVLNCMIVETILHICNAKQYIINNLIKVYTNFQWKFQMILDCTFCAFLHSGKCLHRESALLQKDLTWCMHSSLNTKIHFKEVYLSRREISHC